MTDQDRERLVKKACGYERAVGRMEEIIKIAKQIQEEENDPSCKPLLHVLESGKTWLDNKRKEAWRVVDDNLDPLPSAFDKFRISIALQAVLDYEQAVCRKTKEDVNTITEVEKFFATVSPKYTDVLDKVRLAAKELEMIVAERGEEIINWTDKKRETKGVSFEDSPVRCPMCGRGLFHFGKPVNGVYRIKCCGCNLETWWRKPKAHKIP